MKKTLIVLFLIMVFLGCKGEDGEDGISYLASDWVFVPLGATFPQLPGPPYYRAVDYEHPAGTYWSEYVAWDSSYHSFYYTIEVNEGEEGGLFWTDGDDGAYRYYEMWLYSWGAEIYYWDDKSIEANQQKEQQKATKLGISPPVANTIEKSQIDKSQFDLNNPEITVTEKVIGDRKFTIESKKYKLK